MLWLLMLLACAAHICCSEERSTPPSPVQGVHQPGLMRLHDRLKADLPTPDVRPLLEAHQNMSVNLTASLFQLADVVSGSTLWCKSIFMNSLLSRNTQYLEGNICISIEETLYRICR